jgi:hypothetical protein
MSDIGNGRRRMVVGAFSTIMGGRTRIRLIIFSTSDVRNGRPIAGIQSHDQYMDDGVYLIIPLLISEKICDEHVTSRFSRIRRFLAAPYVRPLVLANFIDISSALRYPVIRFWQWNTPNSSAMNWLKNCTASKSLTPIDGWKNLSLQTPE